ncbi:MAG: HAMP domain-containing histidine kinase [Prolixibacteraceae bacterium]|nr:HAMP domain-containing histidine kinase [Burkholderiales bacterium]
MSEREETDNSLRTERESADLVLQQRQVIIENAANFVLQRARGDADAVLAAARELADAVLAVARERADRRLEQTSPQSLIAPRVNLINERALADETVRDERASADESLRDERQKDTYLFSKLLPLERGKTDRYLLTERARSDDALAHRDDFLGMVTHDLRDLLGGLVMSTDLLAKDAPANEVGYKTRVETQRMQRYAARMNRLIGDLVDVASIDAGKFVVTSVRGDPNSLIAEAVDAFQATATAKGLSLQLQCGEPPLLAEFDHDRILQVLANLITNSIKFSPQGGQIWIRSDCAGDEQHFSVSDSGPGIASDMLESIFDRFWQIGKNDRRGLGLGLYISKCIVAAHGGRIWAESKLGEGTTVRFTLPRSAAQSHTLDAIGS